MAAKNSRKACSSPAASSQPDAARWCAGADGHRLPAALVRLAPAGRPEGHAAGRPQAQRGDHSGEALGASVVGIGSSAGASRSSTHRSAGCRRPPRGDGVVRCVEGIAAHDREAVAQLEPVDLHPRAAQRRHHTRAHGVAVERDLDLAVDPLEALLGESEAGGVLVEPLEHRLKRRLGLLAAQPVHPQPGGRARPRAHGRPAHRPAARAVAASAPRGTRRCAARIGRGRDRGRHPRLRRRIRPRRRPSGRL